MVDERSMAVNLLMVRPFSPVMYWLASDGSFAAATSKSTAKYVLSGCLSKDYAIELVLDDSKRAGFGAIIADYG